MKKTFFFPFSALLFSLFLFGKLTAQNQQSFRRISAPVQVNGHNLAYPFAGGLNAPQFSPADLDQDFTQDLVLFDRVGNVLLTFINEGTPGNPNYVYRPEYACNFPDSLTDWMLMRDFDQDGAMNIFCAATAQSSQEIQVYKGYYDGYGLKFKHYLFSYPANCDYCNPLYIFYPDDNPAFWNNLPVNRGDVPSIDDIDGDGDLDIVAFPAGTSTTLTMLRNLSVEKGFGLNKLEYELYDKCWGRFYENGMEYCRARLSCHPDTCAIECSGGLAPIAAEERDNLHPGAALATYDHDGDGDRDLMLTNVSHPCVVMMTNGADAQTAWMTAQDTAFPNNNVPVEIYTFPAPYYFDYDQDGKKDLVAALNNPVSGEDRKGIWWYKNTASAPGQHSFSLQTRSLFVDEMIDLGTGAHPAITDVNADGLLDLVVGNYGFYSRDGSQTIFTNSQLALFLNIGSPTAPAFELADSDWAGLSVFAPDDYDFSPTFGDLDGDGDFDMLVGSNIGGFYFYRNTAGPDQPMILEYEPSAMWLGMDVVGSISSPILYDLDGDGRLDIVAGERSGNVNFFKNNGTGNTPVFSATPTLQKIGQIDTRVPPDVAGMSTPVIISTPDGAILVSGTQRGQLEAYYLQGANEMTFPTVSLHWGNVFEGFRSHPAFADFDGDGILEMVLGNQRGGLSLFKTEMVSCEIPLGAHTPENAPELHISPNPAKSWARVDWDIDKPVNWQVFDALGRLVKQGASENGRFNVELRGWPAGIYVLRAGSDGRSATGRLVVHGN